MDKLSLEQRSKGSPLSDGELGAELGIALQPKEQVRNSWTIAWCHAGDSGGSKRAAFEMVRELARRGHVVDEYIIRVGEPNLRHWPLQPYVRNSFCTLFKPMRNRMRPYVAETWVALVQNIWGSRHIRKELKQLAGLINKRGYDFVHIDRCAPSWLVSLLPHLRPPSIVYSHESSNLRYRSFNDTMSGQHSFFRQMYAAFCAFPATLGNSLRSRQDLADMRHAQVILTNSCYSREAMFLRGCLTARVCPYGVDVERFHSLSIMVEPMILSVGRVVEPKQHHMVIEAVGLIEEALRPRVVIATPEDKRRQEDPEYGMNVARLAKEKGVDLEVRINPTEQELVVLYNRALAVVFVPIMEPFGLVALEAMACGTPVIGVREGGVRESVRDGITGVLVERDAKEIAGAIEYLQRHEAIRTKLSKQAVQYVRETWSWQKSIDRYQKEIGRLVSRAAAAPGHTT